MQTPHTMANWSHARAQLCADFPELSDSNLPDTINTLSDVACILAQAHDLTLYEALQTLDDWELTYIPADTIRHAA